MFSLNNNKKAAIRLSLYFAQKFYLFKNWLDLDIKNRYTI